jgi:hypothetical protein
MFIIDGNTLKPVNFLNLAQKVFSQFFFAQNFKNIMGIDWPIMRAFPLLSSHYLKPGDGHSWEQDILWPRSFILTTTRR